MGLQDRDYYWEKHRKTAQSNRHREAFEPAYCPRPKPNNLGLQFLLYPLIAIGILWYAADLFLQAQTVAGPVRLPPSPPISPTALPASVPSAPAVSDAPEAAPSLASSLVLKADPQGHFRGVALINGVPMPFLIDTGATKTVIPDKMAVLAKLPSGNYIQANTAGGKVAERETVIDSLALGNSVIKNLEAHTNPYLEEVLIGMNTLKHFRMIQDGNSLTLAATGQEFAQASDALMSNQDTLLSQPSKKPLVIKKTISCDARQVCTTKYSDR